MTTNRSPMQRSGSQRIPESCPPCNSPPQWLWKGVTLNPSAHGQPRARPALPLPLLILSLPPYFIPAIPAQAFFQSLSFLPLLPAFVTHSILPEHLSHCQSIFPRRDEPCQEGGSTKPSRPWAREKGSSQAAFGSRSMRIAGWETLGGA